MSKPKYLRGFNNFGILPIVSDTATAYSVGERVPIPGAVSCAPTDNKTEYTIPADDGVWDSGSTWDSSTVVVTVTEAELEMLAQLTGATIDKDVMEESTVDDATPVAINYAALRRDGGYRMFAWLSAKLTGYKVSHNTRKEGAPEGQNYELTFKCLGRKCDNKIRLTADTDESISTTWLETIPAVPAG